jgi:hypothetical protein
METAIQWATLGTLAVGFLGLIIAVSGQRKATYAQIITHYAARFERLRNQLPVELVPGTSGDRGEALSDEGRSAFIQYLDITYEEWYMRKHGYFPRGLWKLWKEDIAAFLSMPTAQLAWHEAKAAYRKAPGFCSFVEQCIQDSSSK